MAVRTGVMSSSTPGKALYDLVAVDLAANANWSRPSVSSLTGATNSHGANWTSQIWKCTVGTQVFHVIFSYDTATTPLELWIQMAEAYDGSDGGGVPAAAKFRRWGPGGTIATNGDNISVTPTATDIAGGGAADGFLNSTNPNFAIQSLLGTSGAFPYLFKVTNKTVTIGISPGGTNRWTQVGGFESLVTGPSDPNPIAQFGHGANSRIPKGTTLSTLNHGDGIVTRNPGLGVAAETGAFFVCLAPLHAPVSAVMNIGTANFAADSALAYAAAPPRWYNKVLMSQAVIHQSVSAGGAQGQTFRGYFPDLFGGVISGTAEPIGGGVDAVIIDGVTYYWLGANCAGQTQSSIVSNSAAIYAIRAD